MPCGNLPQSVQPPNGWNMPGAVLCAVQAAIHMGIWDLDGDRGIMRRDMMGIDWGPNTVAIGDRMRFVVRLFLDWR